MGKFVLILMALCAFAAAQNTNGIPPTDNPNQRTTNDGNTNQGNPNSGNQGNPNPANPNPGNPAPDNQGNPNPGNPAPENQGNPNPGGPNNPPTGELSPFDDKKCCGKPLRDMKECCESPSLVSEEDIDQCVAEMPEGPPVKIAANKAKKDEGKGDGNKGGKQGRGKRDGKTKDGGSGEDKDGKSKENGGSSEEDGRSGKMKGRKGMGGKGRGFNMGNGGQNWRDKFGAFGKRFNPRAMSCVFKKRGFFDKDGKVDQKKVTAAFVDKVNKDWKPVVQSAMTTCFADFEDHGKKNGQNAQNGKDFSASQLVICVRSKMAQNCPAAAEKKSQNVDCAKSKAALQACDPFHIPPRGAFGHRRDQFKGMMNKGREMMAAMGGHGKNNQGNDGPPEGMSGEMGGSQGGMGVGPQGGKGGGPQGGGMGAQKIPARFGFAPKSASEMSGKKKGDKEDKEMVDKERKGNKKMNEKEKGNSQKAAKSGEKKNKSEKKP